VQQQQQQQHSNSIQMASAALPQRNDAGHSHFNRCRQAALDLMVGMPASLWCVATVQVNKQGMKLQCSHYFPLDAKSQDGKLPVVVYCHCNSGSRRDAEEAVYHLLPCGVGVVAFDFTVSIVTACALCVCRSCAADKSAKTAVQHVPAMMGPAQQLRQWMDRMVFALSSAQCRMHAACIVMMPAHAGECPTAAR
jgi:hypothetical protein